MFLRKPVRAGAPLPMTMSGVRMGERVLQIGVDDQALSGAMAAKVGLSGHAAMAVGDEAAAERARRAAADAGSLLEVHVTPFDVLPFTDGGFDVIVVNSLGGLLASLADRTRAGLFGECLRVLRQGGRLVAIEAQPPSGVSALLRRGRTADAGYEESGGTAAALEQAGFRPVRLLAEREGYRFTEGLKGA